VSLANWIASSSVLNGISGATGPKTSSLKQKIALTLSNHQDYRYEQDF
jgi:hypothetical protein